MKLNNLVIIGVARDSCQLRPLKERIRVVRTLPIAYRQCPAEMEYAPAATQFYALVAYCG